MDSFFEKYLSDIHSWIPLNRILLFFLAATLSVISHAQLNQPLMLALLEVKVARIGLEQNELYAGATFGDLALAMLLVLLSWSAYILFAKLFAKRLWRRLDIHRRVAEQYAFYDHQVIEAEIRLSALEAARSAAASRVIVVKRMANVAELFIGFGVTLGLFSMLSSLYDLLVSLGLLTVGVVVQVLSIGIYLRTVLPYELHVSALSGLKIRLGMPSA